MTDRIDARERDDEYWDWAAVALFLFLTVDLLTSLAARSAVGVDGEVNPLMALVLDESLAVIVVAHVLVLVVLAGLFHALFELVRELPAAYRRPTAVSVECFLGLLVAAGFAVFANNLAVIAFGRGLF
ncbi:hypothetical protein [Halovivax limisalsi]|uniref:hypothetical protein n=1 Tax=Halovivax limisalsi TaxID=1453760 RepID=UPI001FFC2D52|nr:hypothetical protein [Halovivax limisalsi]